MALPALATAARTAVTSVASNPQLRQLANEFVAKATGGKVTNIANLSPNSRSDQALAVQAAAMAGVRPDDIWGRIEAAGLGEAERVVYQATLRAFNGRQQALDAKFGIPEQPRDFAQRLLDKKMVEWARTHFGSSEGALRAHAQLRAFLAIDSDDLHQLLKIS